MHIYQRAVIGLTVAAVAVLPARVPSIAAPQRWVEPTFYVRATDTLFVTHSGVLPVATAPTGIPKLTEPALRSTFALGGKVRDSGGRLAGIATELEEVLPDTDFPAGMVHTRTLWTLFLPDRGSITFDQFERSDQATAQVFKRALETGTPWVGNLTTRRTEGRTGRIVAGTGEFAGITGSAVEINHLYRFDPRTGELVADAELRLRYRIAATAEPARGRKVERSFFAPTPDGLVFLTHNGETPIGPLPASMPRLTEPELRTSFALGAKLRDSRGRIIGLTTELEYLLPDTDPAAGRVHNRTLWTFFIPGRGTIVFDEEERQDEFFTNVVKPAVETGRPWVGDVTFTTTVPRTGVIVGGTGEFAGITGTGVEIGRAWRFDPGTRTLEGVSQVRLRYRPAC